MKNANVTGAIGYLFATLPLPDISATEPDWPAIMCAKLEAEEKAVQAETIEHPDPTSGPPVVEAVMTDGRHGTPVGGRAAPDRVCPPAGRAA